MKFNAAHDPLIQAIRVNGYVDDRELFLNNTQPLRDAIIAEIAKNVAMHFTPLIDEAIHKVISDRAARKPQ